MMKIILILSLISLATCSQYFWQPIPDANETKECGTFEVWKYLKEPKQNRFQTPEDGCGLFGTCDDPSVRNAMNTSLKIVNVLFHIIEPTDLTFEVVNSAIDSLELLYNSYSIGFNVKDIQFHSNENGECLPPYSNTDDTWYVALMNMKAKYAVDPETILNIFVSCQQPAAGGGTLLGIATFPWDEDALKSVGGLWINSITINSEGQAKRIATLPHELGHNFGLWHTFHGVSEVSGCGNACKENVHPIVDPQADTVGDFCADTPATPQNYNCAAPSGGDCLDHSWGTTDYENMMGYSRVPSDCRTHFTDSQMLRMHCWLCDTLKSQVQSGC